MVVWFEGGGGGFGWVSTCLALAHVRKEKAFQLATALLQHSGILDIKNIIVSCAPPSALSAA